MNILSILISYSAVALLLWWVLGESRDATGGKLLAHWKGAALLGAPPQHEDALPWIAPLLPVTALAGLADRGRRSATRPC